MPFAAICIVHIIDAVAPLQIIYTIVYRVLVFVIYLRQIVWVRDVSMCNKSMHKFLFISCTIIKCNVQIPFVVI